ncbi:16S rRNA (adenine(1518)-N(6)/adenine(1519)-N(6))-dimethyltransferase RsmA [Sulfuricurvum sp.]|uniref:16S rRNA (adenine(1518)-N(6)/adenine(1519)-N(6))- dimethyltransferase RsmA n=1 Tax=Sulfuricurvum sp. TaxID=2025608 RepID=UPI00198DD090|nr:16S rRNA (adenine(1518)-N(6)/adenine(1519)-N(6))-dimethyltransferase RsmA [Sulfuricurvum sp.]MBD3799030.1 16S rRNA (adenine(1518)-N(6)/adenine(1519)-N(6))-dimethyltransferase RsmA [Campylobacterota bacterium]MBD3806041.1 16S rRNA (adenine(1518)-N(6)/adenine(1519)-N(6))-dimethyltransferase RsmA [Sulfuricurvum sp.]
MQKDRATIAKKKFGQNFLNDESVLQQIIQSMPDTPHRIAEIGPGLGDLTKYLVDVKSVSAFEVDTDLCKHLEHQFADAIATNALTLRCGDVLEHWKSELLDEPYDLVANLPYYIATNIILKALADPACRNLLVMIQREVAEKFSAAPGERAFGALSVITQSVGDAEIVLHVPPTAFDPAPKVDSSVLLISKRTNRNDERFEEFLRAAFTQPRKTLYKNLSTRYDGTLLAQAYEALELEKTIRPHQLCTADFHRLYSLI